MLHGFMGTAHTHFSKQIASLEEQYEIILLDLPGHGNSTVAASDHYIEHSIDYLITELKNKGKGYIIGL